MYLKRKRSSANNNVTLSRKEHADEEDLEMCPRKRGSRDYGESSAGEYTQDTGSEATTVDYDSGTDMVPVKKRHRPRKMSPQEAIVRKRESRKVCEQNRRDRMQRYLSEIGARLPVVQNSKKRVTKLGILRLSLSYLRFQHFLDNRQTLQTTSPSAYTDAAKDLLLKNLGAFLMVLDVHGTVVHLSDSAADTLHTDLADIVGTSLYNLIDPDDHLSAGDALLEAVRDPAPGQESSSISFTCRFVRSPHVTSRKRTETSDRGTITCEVTARRENTIKTGHDTFDCENSQFVVCVVQPLGLDIHFLPQFTCQGTWWTKTDMNFVIIDIDVHCSFLMTGRMRKEIVNTEQHRFVHPEDHMWQDYGVRQVLEKGSLRESCVRCNTVDGRWLYTFNDSHVEYDRQTGKPLYIISVSRFVPEYIGICALHEQRRLMREQLQLEGKNMSTRLSIDSGIHQSPSYESHSESERSPMTSTTSTTWHSDHGDHGPQITEITDDASGRQDNQAESSDVIDHLVSGDTTDGVTFTSDAIKQEITSDAIKQEKPESDCCGGATKSDNLALCVRDTKQFEWAPGTTFLDMLPPTVDCRGQSGQTALHTIQPTHLGTQETWRF